MNWRRILAGMALVWAVAAAGNVILDKFWHVPQWALWVNSIVIGIVFWWAIVPWNRGKGPVK